MLDEENRLLLASGSPRRREMLELLGVPFSVLSPEVDEAVTDGEEPATYVERVAKLRMSATRNVLSRGGPAFRAVITADTIVVVDGRILGKPAGDEDALAMITALAGRTHEVQTCFCVADLLAGEMRLRRVTTEVDMRSAGAQELSAYVATGEGRDKAGAYAIQGRGAAFVRSIRGSHSSVVGLPLSELVEELMSLGLL